MSAFKFACPVCGQHITCDSSSSGTQMDCPTCFRQLIVPQPPASDSPGFVLTAKEVQSRPSPGSEAQAAALPTARPRRSLPLVWIALGICMGATGMGILLFREKLAGTKNDSTSSAPTAPTHSHSPNQFPPPSTNWTLNLSDAHIPTTAASGMIVGKPFSLERSVIRGGRLDLRQGPEWPPDLGLSLYLYTRQDQDLAGQTVTLEPTRTNSPRLVLRWKDPQGNAVTKEFRNGYAARVEFGAVVSNRLTGKIYVAAPDAARSYAAGTFDAEIRRPTAK